MNETRKERQWLVRSHWPAGAVTEAIYTTSARAAELEAYFRQRYSGCRVEPIQTRVATYTDWELAS